MALQVAADHRAIENIERGKQGGGAVALVERFSTVSNRVGIPAGCDF